MSRSTPAAVGVDVGGTRIKAVRLVEDQVVDRSEVETPGTPDGIVAAVAALSAALGEGLPLGVGLAGLVDVREGKLVWGPHLPGEDVAVADPLRRSLGVAVTVDNDANLAALAESRMGVAAGLDPMIMLTLGTGIGMGIIISDRIYRGRGFAGEVGHVTVEPDGQPCACGRRGCWETRVSGRLLDAEARRLLGPGASAADLVETARAGDSPAIEALAEAGRWLAVGVEALALAMDPAMVVVGGAAARAGDLLLGPARTRLEATEGARHRKSLPLVAGILGADAGAIGAAILAGEEQQHE
jgi:glucokinase